MAEKVIIRVSTDGAKKTLEELSSIKSKVDELNKSSVSIKLNSGSGGKGGSGSAAKEVQDLSGKVAELTKGMRIAKETTTEFSDAATKNAKKYTDDVNRMVTVTEQGNRTMIQSTQKYEKVLTDQAKAAHTAEVQSKALSNAYGDLIDHQEKIVDGQVVQAMNKYRDAAGNVTTITSKLDGETVKVTTSIKSASEETKKLSDNAELAAKRNSLLGDSLDRIVAKIVAWQVINAAVAATIRSFKEAVQTMKAVDSELVQVRKVTGFTADEMKRVEEQAYKTASAYGVAADAYLESVAAFARAGYKEQSTELAELSTKTQIVGDTTAEIANQFLLSVDAAYQYKGSIEELTKVLDGANEIDNKYATSIEKIAEGMGIVAPVAKQVNVGIDELAAAIGTITAVTQRSGSEAARALRALFLNIVGDTKTEIEEGVTWTTGEIKGLQDVIKIYAKDAYEAAQATGEVLNPMEAIAGLAQSMKDGVLSAAELTSMVSDIGGKLRTSQLLAIIQNWDMYQSMLVDYGNAIGSADKEVANALDSWERKTAQLKNAWTQFISHLVDTREIKNGIDAITALIKFLDSPIGQATAKVTALTAAFIALNKISKGALFSTLTTLIQYFMGVESSELLAAQAAGTLDKALMGLKIMAVVAIIYAVIKALDAMTVSFKEQKEILEQLNKQYEEQFGAGSEYDVLLSKIDNLTAAEQARLDILEGQKKALQDQIQSAEQLAAQKWLEENSRNATSDGYIVNGAAPAYKAKYDSTGHFAGYDIEIADGTITSYQKHLDEINAEIETSNELLAVGASRAADYRKSLSETVATHKDYYDGLVAAKKAGLELKPQEEAFIALYEQQAKKLSDLAKAEKGATEQSQKLSLALQDEVTIYNSLKAKVDPLITALDELNQKGAMSEETMKALIEAYPDLQSAITVTANGFVIEKQAIQDLIDAQIAEYQTVYDNAVNAANQIVNAESTKLRAINATTLGIKDQLYALAHLYEAQFISRRVDAGDTIGEARRSFATGTSQEYAAMTEMFAAANAISVSEANLASAKRIAGLIKGGTTSGGGTGSSTSETDEQIEALKAIVELRKQELSFIKESSGGEQAQVEKMREIQAALHAQAEYLRSIGADEKDIIALSTEWWQIENQIADIQEKIAKQLNEDIAGAFDDILESLTDAETNMVDPLQAQLDALNKVNDATKEQRKEQEKIAAVQEKQLELEKAKLALENAQNERNVRHYNAATGKWEWVANAKTVESAQQNYDKAQQNLADAQSGLSQYYEDTENEQQRKELENKIKAINSSFSALNKAIKEAAKAIKDGKMTFEEAYAYIEAAMKEIYDKYGVELSDTFDDAVDSLDEASKNLFKSVRTTSSLAEAFKSLQNVIEKIPEEFRTRVLAAINAIFGNDSLSNQAKAIILSDINALFTNTELRTETKTRVVEAIAHLVGNSNDARSAVDLFEEYISVALQNAKNPEDAINELVDNILKSGDQFGYIDSILSNVHTETGKLLAIAKMRLNSAEWYTAGADRRQQLHDENVQLGTAMGWNFESSTGNWLDENGNVAYTVSSGGLNSADSFYNSLIDAISKITVNVDTKVTANGNTSTSTTTTSASTSSSPPSSSSSGNQSSGGGTSSSSNTSTSTKPKTYNNISATGGTYVYDNWGGKVWLTASDVAKINSYAPGTPGEIALSGGAYASISSNGTVSVRKGTFYGTYDYGGILHGLGGIKDTTEDEMVLPPRMTKSLIEAETSGAFNALLDHLGIVTAAANNIAGFGGGVPNNSVGEQYNGDSYNFGNISLTESQAKSMTVYDLAQMSRNLGLTS